MFRFFSICLDIDTEYLDTFINTIGKNFCLQIWIVAISKLQLTKFKSPLTAQKEVNHE